MTDVSDEAILAEFVSRFGAEPQRWIPHEPHPKQAEFLALDCLEALYGGAAGGGKSDALLMAALQDVDHPDYAAICFRRTFADLALPGALMDRSHEWLANTAAHWTGDTKTWRFPSGATLSFGYLEHDKDKFRYQGSEFQFIAYDELTQFEESQYTYLFSRLRKKTGSKLRLRMRGATNPGGVGHDWVEERFKPGKSTGDTVWHGGRAFVPALLEDNPSADKDSYETSLAQLDETTFNQLRKGMWIRDAQTLIYKYRPERNAVPMLPKRKDWYYVLSIDLGASEAKPSTAFVVWAFSYEVKQVYMVRCELHPGMIPATIAERSKELDKDYHFVGIVMDEGALGKGYGNEFRERYVIPVQPAEKANKLGYRKLMNGDLEKALVLVVESQCEPWVKEVGKLIWNKQGTDNEKGQPNHCSDSALYGWREAKHWLAKEPEDVPKRGTPERAEYEAQKMFEEELAQTREKKSFWERR